MLAVRSHPGVAVGGLDDLVGDETHVLLGHRVVEGAADEALDGEEGALGIGDRLTLGGLADEALAVVGESDDRGRGARAFRVLDDLGRRALHDRDAGIGRPQVDADDFSHCVSPCFARPRGPEAARPGARCCGLRAPVPDARLISRGFGRHARSRRSWPVYRRGSRRRARRPGAAQRAQSPGNSL